MNKFLIKCLRLSRCLMTVPIIIKITLFLNEELTYFQLRCPCPDFFPPLHGFPILSPMVQKLFRDYFCPRIGIWEESIINQSGYKNSSLPSWLWARPAGSQNVWTKGRWRVQFPSGNATARINLWHGVRACLLWDWTSGLCCPRSPCRGRAQIRSANQPGFPIGRVKAQQGHQAGPLSQGWAGPASILHILSQAGQRRASPHTESQYNKDRSSE